MACLRHYFGHFVVPTEISFDEGPELISTATENFLKRWGDHHRLSSAYYPQSNGRAEVAVKSAKRLFRSNTGPSEDLNSDRSLRSMLQLRNTLGRTCDLSQQTVARRIWIR